MQAQLYSLVPAQHCTKFCIDLSQASCQTSRFQTGRKLAPLFQLTQEYLYYKYRVTSAAPAMDFGLSFCCSKPHYLQPVEKCAGTGQQPHGIICEPIKALEFDLPWLEVVPYASSDEQGQYPRRTNRYEPDRALLW